jgi:hypothetical protein
MVMMTIAKKKCPSMQKGILKILANHYQSKASDFKNPDV